MYEAVKKLMNEGECYGYPNNLDNALGELYAHKLMRERQKAKQEVFDDIEKLLHISSNLLRTDYEELKKKHLGDK